MCGAVDVSHGISYSNENTLLLSLQTFEAEWQQSMKLRELETRIVTMLHRMMISIDDSSSVMFILRRGFVSSIVAVSLLRA